MSKYPRTYHLGFSPGATSDDKISDDISNLIGSEIVITEKLDGENTGITNEGVYARSHSAFTISPWSREVRQLFKTNIEGHLDENVFIFGENMEGIHSIEYTNLKSYFYMFGVRDNNIWVTWDQVEEYAYLLDLNIVPVLFRGVINTKKELMSLINKFMKEDSLVGGEKEGVVVRTTGVFHNDDFDKNVAKFVRKDHVQTDEHWTRKWKKAKIN